MPTLSSIISLFSGLLNGLAKLAGSIGIYLAGKRGAKLDFEKAARKDAEEDAERWKNRPRNRDDAVVRLRDYKKPKK